MSTSSVAPQHLKDLDRAFDLFNKVKDETITASSVNHN